MNLMERQVGIVERLHLHGQVDMAELASALDTFEVKDHMARAVSELLHDGEAVAVDSGTTGSAVAKEIAGRRLTVMPFSVQALTHLATSPTITLLLPGGSVNPDEGSITGPLAEASLRSLRFDTAVLSCCGVSEPDGVTAYDLFDAATKGAMIRAARRTILVAGGEKFTHSAMAVVCELNDVDILVTDATSPAETLDRLGAAGIQVIVVPTTRQDIAS